MVAVDQGAAVPGWAPIRSRDCNHAYGEVTTRTRSYTAEIMGACSDVVCEVEYQHNTILQCPTKIREGESNFYLCNFELYFIGTTGQYCSQVKDVYNTPVKKQCEPCSESKQLIDNEYGNLYSFSCKTATKMTNCVGIRPRSGSRMTNPELEMDPATIRHRYGYAMNEVPDGLFEKGNHGRKLKNQF